jgi:hypothetical protein
VAPGAVASGGPVGTTTQEPNGKVKVELDRQLIVDLRRMLTNAGLEPS